MSKNAKVYSWLMMAVVFVNFFVSASECNGAGCQSVADGMWSNPATWSGCTGTGGIPGAADDAWIFGHTVEMDANATVDMVTCSGTLKMSTYILSVSYQYPFNFSGTFDAGTGTVILSDADHRFDDNLTFNNLSMDTLSFPRTISFGVFMGSSATITVNGTFISGSSPGKQVSFVKNTSSSGVANAVTSYYCASNGGIANITCLPGGPMPTAPDGLTVGTITQTSVVLNWNDNSSNETGFNVYDGATFLGYVGPGVKTYTADSLTCNTNHTFTVKATNDGTKSAAAATSPVITTTSACGATYAFATATAGTGTVGGTSAGSYAAGTAITLTATPTGGATFAGWSAGCSSSFTMPANALTCIATFNPPITAGVTLNSVGNITGSTVLATGTATGAGIEERGFYWWIPPSDATHFGGSESGLIPEGYGAGSFSLKLTDLRIGHTYHVKAYVKVGGQIITSDEQLFTTVTTGKMAPTVLTDTANYTVSGNSITVNGEITDVGSTPVNVYGFIYAPHIAPYTGDDMPKTGDTAYAMWDKVPVYQGMKFTATVKNIPPGKWYLRAYAHNTNPDSDAAQTASLGYGADISFTIPCTPETCIPGDVNGDGRVSLDDAMLVLRILAGMPVGNINPNADVNGDGKIGIEELGFILQKVAELR